MEKVSIADTTTIFACSAPPGKIILHLTRATGNKAQTIICVLSTLVFAPPKLNIFNFIFIAQDMMGGRGSISPRMGASPVRHDRSGSHREHRYSRSRSHSRGRAAVVDRKNYHRGGGGGGGGYRSRSRSRLE